MLFRWIARNLDTKIKQGYFHTEATPSGEFQDSSRICPR
ncbi:unnamed protein product [Acidithrix sp. C25]|nr:unnamed protein product [Acidithrix sp. C25]